MLYFAFVHPHLLYGVEVYPNTHSSYLEKLMVLSNKMLRIVQFKPLKTHVLNLYNNYNTLPVLKLHISFSYCYYSYSYYYYYFYYYYFIIIIIIILYCMK